MGVTMNKIRLDNLISDFNNEYKTSELKFDKVKPTTIVFMDLSGSTFYKYNKEFGEGYHKTKLHNYIIKKIAASFGGKVHKEIGDEVLLTFENPLNACKACVKIFDLFNEYNASRDGQSEDDRIYSKAGIHYGSILHEPDGDIYGSAVDFAARLIGLAIDNQIIISDHVQNLVRNRISVSSPYSLNLEGIGNQLIYEIPIGNTKGISQTESYLRKINEKLDKLVNVNKSDSEMYKSFGLLSINSGQRPMRERIENLRRETNVRMVKIFAISGMKHWTDNNFVHFLNKANADVKVLLLNPRSKWVDSRCKEYGNYGPKQMALEIKAATEKLLFINQSSKCNVPIRYYNSYPVFRMVQVDNEIYLGGYLHGISSVESPVYHFRQADGSMFNYFEKWFDKEWEASNEISLK